MRHSEAAKEFARHFFRKIEQRSRGEWVGSSEIFNETIRDHSDNAYVKYLSINPARRIKVTYVLQDVEAEFPHVERRKNGASQSSRVYWRTNKSD